MKITPALVIRRLGAVGFGWSILALAPAQTPAAYQTQWRDPALQTRIERNIEAHRKGDTTIAVVDAAGRPVSGAKVQVRQTRHAFLFGCNAFVLG